VEPFLLSSSLIGVLAQRLVRVLCDNCKQPYPASAADCEQLGIDAGDPPTLYRAAGCPECSQLGYKGRTGIYELIELDDEMRGRIHDGAGEQALEAYARQHAPSMRHDGWRRVLAGVTTVEEVLRVSKEG
jgi:general secretion pathway protein E